VTGFNSFQYAANPDTALAQAKRVSKSGGAVVIVTWGKPEGMQAATLIGALKAIVPPPPPGTPGPFALSDEHALREFATKAGLEPMEVFDVDSPFHYADLSTALRGLMSSGNAIRAAELSSDDAVRIAYTGSLEDFVNRTAATGLAPHSLLVYSSLKVLIREYTLCDVDEERTSNKRLDRQAGQPWRYLLTISL